MKKVSCPICDEPMPGSSAEWPEYPFCSKRCRTIDLGRWLKGSYNVEPIEKDESSQEEPD